MGCRRRGEEWGGSIAWRKMIRHTPFPGFCVRLTNNIENSTISAFGLDSYFHPYYSLENSSFDIRLQQMLGIFYTLRWIPIQTGILRGLPVDGRKDIRAGGCLESSEVLYSRVGELLRNVQVPPPPRERWQARWLDSDGMCKLGSSLRARVP